MYQFRGQIPVYEDVVSAVGLQAVVKCVGAVFPGVFRAEGDMPQYSGLILRIEKPDLRTLHRLPIPIQHMTRDCRTRREHKVLGGFVAGLDVHPLITRIAIGF
jgi:hypothetical protein